jgi:tyrosine-specific transport protein
MRYKYFCAVAVLIGMIVGAGTFGIPYVFAQAGFLAGFFYLLVLGLAAMLVHLFYGEIILRTNQPHQLVGYAAKYLGSRVKKIATFVLLFQYYGALLAYLILGGQFLAVIFSAWLAVPEVWWVLVFFALGAAGIFVKLNTLARNELLMTGILLIAVVVLLVMGASHVKFENFGAINFSKFFLPYGVILFAMAGAAAVPEMRQILQGQEKRLKSAIILGTLLPAVLYLLFALVVVGVTGSHTTQEAIEGLVPYLGRWVIILGAVFGFFAVYTSFLVLGMAIKKIYQQDYRMRGTWAFLLACLVPLAAYLAGLKNFILIVGIIGAVFSGLDGILTILIYLKARQKGDRTPEYRLKWAKVLGFSLIILFSLGIIYQFFYLSG